MFLHEQQCCENNLGSTPFAAKLNAQFTAHSSRHLETLFLAYSRRRRRCDGTPPLSETRLWTCRGRRRACSERAGRAADAGAARRRRQTARQSRCGARRHFRRGGRSPHAGRGALGSWPRPSSRLGPKALGLAPPPLASPALGLASPPSLAPPLLAPSSLLLVRRRQRPLGIKKPRASGALSCFGNINKRGSVRSATRCRKDTRGQAAPRRPELQAVPRRPGLAEPQRPGDWAGNHHRGHDASRGRIHPRLPPR